MQYINEISIASCNNFQQIFLLVATPKKFLTEYITQLSTGRHNILQVVTTRDANKIILDFIRKMSEMF